MVASQPTERTVQTFESSQGAEIYQLPLEVFPDFWGFVYLVFVDEYRVLIDTGSNYPTADDHLEAGLKTVSEIRGEKFGLSDLTHVLITHAHIDHFGGLAYVHPRTEAKIGVHELDRRVLINYEERLATVSRRLEMFLTEAGVPKDRRIKMLDMYKMPKELFRSVPVDFTYQAMDMRLGPFEMLHVPGHSAGHVVIRVHDVLFSGDHVLSVISPHQAPESLTLHTGLSHYLDSLETLRPWAAEVRLTLCGHNQPIHDLDLRLDEIRALHMERLDEVLEMLKTPYTIAEVSQNLFGSVKGYTVLLALEEAGAHIEYLYQRGLLGVHNIDELVSGNTHIPLQYCRL